MAKKLNKLLIAGLAAMTVTCSAFAFTSCNQTPAGEGYTVTFQTDGGTQYNPAETQNSAQAVTLPTPEKYGYIFMGWYDNAECTGEALTGDYLPSGDVTLYAKWQAIEAFTVVFVSNGGTTYESVTTAEDIVLPTPERFGYVFAGWYESEECTGNALGSLYTPTENTTLYAKWNEVLYTVVFETDGGTAYKNVESDGTAITLPTPEKEGYIFAGWTESADGSGAICEGETYTPTDDITLYAVWTPIEAYATVTFDTVGGTKHAPVAAKNAGDTVNLPTPQKYGYDFLGWYESADCTGDSVASPYAPEGDITLYAGWKQVTYLYLYYGESIEYERISYDYNSGEEIDVSSLTPPEDLIIDGIECPFVAWEYDGGGAVPDTIYVGRQHIYLVATYDYSNLPPKESVKENDDGSVTTTAKAIKVFIADQPQTGSYSLDITVRKGKGGAANAAFRMIHSGNDYAYEDVGTYYIAVGIGPDTGTMQVSRVLNGGWGRLVSNIPLTSLPQAFQDKYNNTVASEKFTFTIQINDYGTSFDIYLDGDYVLTYDNATTLAQFTGTGYGMRSSTTGSIYSNWKYGAFKRISFDTNGGSEVESISYGLGKLHAGVPFKMGYVFNGWYYDQACTQAFDENNSTLSDGDTLYAGWREAKYAVTLMKDGEVFGVAGYETGELILPALVNKVNTVYTGWYYDEACTQKVDLSNPAITADTTIYAGFRYPYGHVTDKGNGAYKVTAKTDVVLGTVDYPYYRVDMAMSFVKGSSGAGGPAIRMGKTTDYAYESGTYIAAGIDGQSGVLQISGVNEGWSRLVPNTALTSLPQTFQDKWNGTSSGAVITFTISMVDYGTYFEVYLDGALAKTVNYDNETYCYNGIGTRSSIASVDFTLTATALGTKVSYQTNGGEAIGDDYYLSGFDFELPAATKADQAFFGWYYDEALTQKVEEDTFAPTQAVTLYARWVDAAYAISFVTNSENTVEDIAWAEGITFVLPTLEKAGETLENGNVVTYKFVGWAFEENGTTFATNDTVFTGDTTLYGVWNRIEKRRYATVTYNEEGHATYLLNDGTRSYGITFPGLEAESGELSATIYESVKDGNAEVRLNFFALVGNEKVNMVEGTAYSNCFIDFFPNSGLVSLGGKIYNVSKQPWNVPVANLADCEYKTYFNSLKAGDVGEFHFRIQYGVLESGNAWVKVYVNNSLLLVTGLTKDDLGGEPLHGIICTPNTTSASHWDLYLAAGDKSKIPGYKTGLTVWQTLKSAITIADVRLNPVYTVSANTNGGSAVGSVFYASGALYLGTPEKDGATFKGWFYDEACTQEVDMSKPNITANTTLYAGWIQPDGYIALSSSVACNETLENIAYTQGYAISLPVLTTGVANKIFVGWFYDEACTQAIDVNNFVYTENMTVYAGWRYPTHSNLTANGDGSWSVGNGSAAGVIGETPYKYTQYDTVYTFTKGVSGAGGPAIRMSIYKDNTYEGNNGYYIQAGIASTSGNFCFQNIIAGVYGRMQADTVLANLPTSWQDKFNGAANGENITVLITVKDFGSYLEVYFDGTLIVKYTNTEMLAKFTGTGYGTRSSTKNVTFRTTLTELCQVTYVTDGGSEEVFLAAGSELPTLENGGTVTENGGATAYYNKFVGWKNEKGETVTVAGASGTYTAQYERVDLITVTFDPDNGDAFIYAYYNAGDALSLPADAVKNGYTENGTTYGYKFLGWFNGDTQAVAGTEVTAPVIYKAKYETSVAHTVTYVTGFEGYTLEASIVAGGETLTPVTPEYAGYRFDGWYTDDAFASAYVAGEVTSSFTLYAKWVQQVTVTFVSDGKTVSTQAVDINTAATLPANPTKANVTKENGNVCSYAFAEWQNEQGTAVTAATVYGTDTTVTAKFNVTEKRRTATVTYDENGNAIYTLSASGNQGVALPIEEKESGEFNITFSEQVKGTNGAEVRICFFIDLGAEAVNINGNAGDANAFINFYPKSGQINLGSKIYNTSKQAWSMTVANLADCEYKTYFNSLAANAKGTFHVRVQYGVLDSGNAWGKIYVNNSLIYVFGLTADDLGGEPVHGMICKSNTTSAASWDNYLAAGDKSKIPGYKVGYNVWQTITGGMVFTNASVKDVYTVSANTNGGSAVKSVFYSSGRLYLDSPEKADATFKGWYYDEACTQAVDMNNPNITANTTLYAGWAEVDGYVTLSSSVATKETLDSVAFTQGYAISLPAVTASIANRVFTGWYYDEACTQAVDASNFAYTENMTVYAGWRYPTHSNFIDNGDGTWKVGNGSAVAVVGETSYGMTKYVMNYTFAKESGGGGGLTFRMNVYKDNSYEGNGEDYIQACIDSEGLFALQRVLNGTYGRLVSNIALADMPTAWQTKYNAAASGEFITAVMVVVDYGTYFEVYIDGDLIVQYTDSATLAQYTGKGYGIRSSTKNVTFDYAVTDITEEVKELTFMDGESVYLVGYYLDGVTTVDALPAPTKDGYTFTGWYTDAACETPMTAITEDCTLYAGWTAVEA